MSLPFTASICVHLRLISLDPHVHNLMPLIRIATRKSALALWQTEHVAARLRAAHPGLDIKLLPLSTQGDKILDSPLAKIGGKGLFVKELEAAILEERADLAVHSMKDVPVALPEGLRLQTILPRENPYDAFVSNAYATLDALPPGARLGTSSLRRQAQIQTLRPDLEILSLRGNVNTRLAKLDAGEYDAIVLACAGLERLGMAARIRQTLTSDISLPAIGQGAIGIECRARAADLHALLAPLDDPGAHDRIRAERALNQRLNGGCQVPIAGYAELDGDTLWLRGLVAEPDGSRRITAEARAPRAQAEALGTQVADALLSQGAGDILARLGTPSP